MTGTYENKKPFPESLPVLNRLLALQQYSLANYLLYANPWVPPGGERLLEAIRQIAANHQVQACRIGRLIVNRRGAIGPGHFPMRFTAYNDLALDYLAQRLLEQERELIDEVSRGVARLDDDPEARRLAEDVLASEERHFKMLTGLLSPNVSGDNVLRPTRLAA
jgi:bacterioferritin (cytochrome b1)